MSDPVIQATGLTKRFDGRAVVDSFDFEVPPGSVTGFLGVNGASKSTTMRMLMGHLSPSAGEVRLFDEVIASSDWSSWEAEYHGRVGHLEGFLRTFG